MESYTLSKTNKKPNQKWAKDLNGHFSKKHTNGQKIHEKKTIIREIEIKPTERYGKSLEWVCYRLTEKRM